MSAPYVNIDIGLMEDGHKRKLRYRHNDMADLEVLTGKRFDELLSGSQFHGIRVLLFYGLRWQEPKMSISKAGDLIQDEWIAKGKTLDEMADVVLSALEAGGIIKPRTPKVEDDEGNAQPEAVTT
jgi:hypothetical protein